MQSRKRKSTRLSLDFVNTTVQWHNDQLINLFFQKHFSKTAWQTQDIHRTKRRKILYCLGQAGRLITLRKFQKADCISIQQAGPNLVYLLRDLEFTITVFLKMLCQNISHQQYFASGPEKTQNGCPLHLLQHWRPSALSWILWCLRSGSKWGWLLLCYFDCVV